MNWESAISTNVPSSAIIVSPANCPADVKFVNEISTASLTVKSLSTARIPKAKRQHNRVRWGFHL